MSGGQRKYSFGRRLQDCPKHLGKKKKKKTPPVKRIVGRGEERILKRKKRDQQFG